jgi:GT2 family glycosyltransferase
MQIEVVDDVSLLDDPAAVVDELGRGRVLFHRNERNLGMFHNFNRCLDRSRGHLIHVLNGDDYVGPDFYRKIGDAFRQSPECHAVFSRSFIVNSNEDVRGTSDFCPSLTNVTNDPQALLMTNPLRTPGVVVRRSLYEHHGGFDTRFAHIGDWEMWVRALVHGGARMLDEPLAYYREHEHSDTSRVVRTAENLRDHMRLSAKWQAAGLSGFDHRAFERKTVRMAVFQALNGVVLGDPKALAANLEFWWQHATAVHYPLACYDTLLAIGRFAARKLR